MKTAILALCLLGAAFSAPLPEYVDPDCIEEDIAVEEPMSEIEAEFALGVPDIELNFGSNNDDECEDDLVPAAVPTAAMVEATESAVCEDDLIETTEAEPVYTTEEAEAAPVATEAECEDEPIEYTDAPTTEAGPAFSTAEDCAETDAATEEPAVQMMEEDGDLCEDGADEGGAGRIDESIPKITNINIEPAMVDYDAMYANGYGEEGEVEPIEECEEY